MKITVITVGKSRKSKYADLLKEYSGRIRWNLEIQEIESRSPSPQIQQKEECEKILSLLQSDKYVIAMDQRGKSISSPDFANKINQLQNEAIPHIVFVIGGSEGLNEEIRNRANFLMSFGHQTWPHMLARTMLLEQIYRAQQILSGHPYHK